MQFRPKKIAKGEYFLNGITLEILHLIHKNNSVQEIAEKISVDNETLKKSLKDLVKNDLIEKVSLSDNFMGKDFHEALKANLAKAIGPLAEYLVEDAFSDFNVNSEKIPKNQAASIIRYLAEEIKDANLKHNFLKKMTEFIKS
jgi:DNA-binding transcriptional regulator YhcF (GntR family)